jgi:hypothetical protein
MSNSGSGRKKDENPVVVSQHPPVPMPFDVVVVSDGSIRRNLSPEEFFALPLAERIQHVVQQRAAFFASGQPVEAKVALAQIRKLRTQLH